MSEHLHDGDDVLSYLDQKESRTPTPPSAEEDLLAQVHEYGCSCNRLGHEMECKTIRAKVARVLSARDERYQRTDEARMQAIQYQGFLNAQLRERERELKTAGTLRVQLSNDSQHHLDRALAAEQEVERLREELAGICSLVESRQARIDHLEQSENEYRHALERWFTIQNKQDVDQWTTKTKALLTRRPAPEEE